MKKSQFLSTSSSILLSLYTIIVVYVVLSFFFGIEYRPFLTPLSTLMAFIFAIDHSSTRLGWRRALLLLGLTFAVSLFFESVGVATGLVYGPYHYTDKLGYQFLGLVPLLDPHRLVYDELPLVHHRQAVDPWREEYLGLAAVSGRSGGGDHDRLGPGDGPHDGSRRALGVGSGGSLLWHPLAELLGLVADDLRDVHPVFEPGASHARKVGDLGTALRAPGGDLVCDCGLEHGDRVLAD